MTFTTDNRDPKKIPYADYGAYVFCDGVRRRDREDTVPFHEAEVEKEFPIDAAWMRALIVRPGKNWHGGMHAVLGDGTARLCIFRLSIRLLLTTLRGGTTESTILSPMAGEEDMIVQTEFVDGAGGAIYFKNRPDTIDVRWVDRMGGVWLARCGLRLGSRWFPNIDDEYMYQTLKRNFGMKE